MKKRIYYAVCFEKVDKTGKTISHDDPTTKGAFALFYHREDALWDCSQDGKIVRVLVTIEPIPSKKEGKEMKMGKFTQFELLQIRFWTVMLKCVAVLVSSASGARPEWKSFDSSMEYIEKFLTEITEIQE